MDLPVQCPLLTWRCSGRTTDEMGRLVQGIKCLTAVPVLRACEVANSSWTLQQNAALLWHWARMQEPSGDDLAAVAFVDDKAVPAWQRGVRDVMAEERRVVEEWLQLGGVGVDVEMDEVSFRRR